MLCSQLQNNMIYKATTTLGLPCMLNLLSSKCVRSVWFITRCVDILKCCKELLRSAAQLCSHSRDEPLMVRLLGSDWAQGMVSRVSLWMSSSLNVKVIIKVETSHE
jgi:hypothetical protein